VLAQNGEHAEAPMLHFCFGVRLCRQYFPNDVLILQRTDDKDARGADDVGFTPASLAQHALEGYTAGRAKELEIIVSDQAAKALIVQKVAILARDGHRKPVILPYRVQTYGTRNYVLHFLVCAKHWPRVYIKAIALKKTVFTYFGM
jgi:hypothetical protein